MALESYNWSAVLFAFVFRLFTQWINESFMRSDSVCSVTILWNGKGKTRVRLKCGLSASSAQVQPSEYFTILFSPTSDLSDFISDLYSSHSLFCKYLWPALFSSCFVSASYRFLLSHAPNMLHGARTKANGSEGEKAKTIVLVHRAEALIRSPHKLDYPAQTAYDLQM